MWAITFIVLAVASQGALSFNALPLAHRQMANIMLKASQSLSNNPERSAQCFPVYSQGIANANDKYAAAYDQCLDTATNAEKAVETEVAADRQTVANQGDAICTSFQTCSQVASAGDFFECYYDAAGSSLSTSLDMQSLSKNKMQYVELRYQTIEYDKNYCTNDCTNTYIKESTALYQQLETCLATGEVVTPAPTTATTTTPTTTPNTEPTTTTEIATDTTTTTEIDTTTVAQI
ncbi:protein TsetseEP [Stomoxys calcitrans]|uniref:protein TsetseEP n=1 Tax=Stomoxys calcitrans TaxID=35570 RepID=UPI0027E3A2A3|nr:protein TsetseEP [Stomoxys calcitrans]